MSVMNRNSAAYGRAGKGESVRYSHGHMDSIPTLASKLLTVVVERVTKNWRPNLQWILQ
jgi:hypothetical protein